MQREGWTPRVREEEAFNSLFEMLVWRGRRYRFYEVELSILYLRCGAGGQQQHHAGRAALSILYLRCKTWRQPQRRIKW